MGRHLRFNSLFFYQNFLFVADLDNKKLTKKRTKYIPSIRQAVEIPPEGTSYNPSIDSYVVSNLVVFYVLYNFALEICKCGCGTGDTSCTPGKAGVRTDGSLQTS